MDRGLTLSEIKGSGLEVQGVGFGCAVCGFVFRAMASC